MNVLTLSDLKGHLNIEQDDDRDDVVIEAYASAAEQWTEFFVGVDFNTIVDFPEPLKQALRMMVGHWFENREAVAMGVTSDMVPFGVFDLLKPYRQWAF